VVGVWGLGFGNLSRNWVETPKDAAMDVRRMLQYACAKKGRENVNCGSHSSSCGSLRGRRGGGHVCLRELLVRDDARLAKEIARVRREVSGRGG